MDNTTTRDGIIQRIDELVYIFIGWVNVGKYVFFIDFPLFAKWYIYSCWYKLLLESEFYTQKM